MVKLRPHGCTEAPLEPPEAPPGHAGFRRERERTGMKMLILRVIQQ